MAAVLCRPHFNTVRPDLALRSWPERPGSARPNQGSAANSVRHETLYEGLTHNFYIVAHYTDACPGFNNPDPWARQIDFTSVCAWLREHQHPMPEDFRGRVIRPW